MLIDLEREYWALQQRLDLFAYFTPVNLAAEKERFTTKLKENSKYNPVFEYRNITYDSKQVLSTLNKLAGQFQNSDSSLASLYSELINEDVDCVKRLRDRRVAGFCSWISNLYGKPDESLYSQAVDVIASLEPEDDDGAIVCATEMRAKVKERLKQGNITGWNVEIGDASSRIYVNPVTKTIGIREGATFSTREIDRLMVHEIGVHICRYENGSRQKYLLFRKGFPRYISTEEGLAILSESKNNLLSPRDLAKYCARFIASYLCYKSDFWDLFKVINCYLDVDDSFDVVARVKRGLVHTQEFGGFTKDQIYFAGYLGVSRLQLERIRTLFLGKIGIQHLDVIDQIGEINPNIELPEWFEND